MSLSFHLVASADTGGEEPVTITVFEGGMTHNVIDMWQVAGVFDALYESKDREAASIIPALTLGVADMELRPSFYEQFNPENGWGSYESALEFLRSVLDACRAHPKSKIWIWR